MDTDYDNEINYKCLKEFPNMVSIDYHVFFKDRICYFYLNLTRKLSHRNVLELSKEFTDVLRLLKIYIRKSQQEYLPYLALFYRMLGQTRDVLLGKGEHEISYMMLLAFYEVYPILAIYALYRFVQPIVGLENSYGSWRDIKYICAYIREHSAKGDSHELIKISIELMNAQLLKDLETWRFSLHPRSQKHISNVAKWIPRENKQFHWLFERLVVDWTLDNKPYIFDTLTKPDSILKAVMKAKRLYRKKVSFLNKALDTTEIKQCSQKICDIEPSRVAWHTLMKQPKLIFGMNETYKECSQKIREHIVKNNKVDEGDSFSNYYPISFFVKEALRLANIGSQKEEKKVEIDILNRLWTRFSRTISKDGFDNVLPIIDSSFFMQAIDSEEYYTAIGFSVLVAERSKFGKRILAVDYQSTWINLDGCDDFVSMIENIHQTNLYRSNTQFVMDNVLELLAHSLLQSKASRRFIENMNLVLFSDFKSTLTITAFKVPFIKLGLSCPTLICWNLSKHDIVDPFYNIDDNIVVMSGISNGCFHSLSTVLQNFKLEKKGVFENIRMILNDGRYDVLESYLNHVVSV
jgi:hypothetical protein